MVQKKKEEAPVTKTKVKDVIAELKLNPSDVVFIYEYMSKEYNKNCLVSELTREQLNKTVITVNSHYGGLQHKYGAYQIIVN
jgi:uncharacterized protein YaiL (DUF2058 family)